MEKTIKACLHQSFVILEIQQVEGLIRSLVPDLTEDYQLKTDEEGIKGTLVKYGLLDLTFENSSGQFILVFCEGENIGYRMERKKPLENRLSVSDYMQKYLSNMELFLPVLVTIKDCCHTDDAFIWKETYFYS